MVDIAVPLFFGWHLELGQLIDLITAIIVICGRYMSAKGHRCGYLYSLIAGLIRTGLFFVYGLSAAGVVTAAYAWCDLIGYRNKASESAKEM
ncbi:MAG: hypothetical protein OHK0017_07680 [Patescibacteria group bacterium]